MGSVNETADHSNFVPFRALSTCIHEVSLVSFFPIHGRDVGFTIGIDGHIQEV